MLLKPIGLAVTLFSLLLPSLYLSAENIDDQTAATLPAQQGELIWADLYSADVSSSIKFYTKTFNWTVKKLGKPSSSYHIFYQNGQAVAGLLERSAKRNKTDKAVWIGSIYTQNVEKVVNDAQKKGATIILKPHEFDLFGTRAVMADPQGGIVAMLDVNSENKPRKKQSANHWSWAQLFSVNTQEAANFYAKAFNYTIEDISGRENAYYLSTQSQVQASVIKMPSDFPQRDRWVNFFEVVGVEGHVAKAVKNGAQVIYASTEQQVAIIADPNGAFIGLTEQPDALALENK